MKHSLAIVTACFATLSLAQSAAPDAKAREDIAAHRRIAAAHEKAARCLESGKKEKECHAHLAADCKEIAIGKYCGMRHKH